MIRSAKSVDDYGPGNGSSSVIESDREGKEDDGSGNKGSPLIDATCVPADIRYPTVLSLLNEAREATEKLIDEMHPQIREIFGPKPRTY